MILDFTKMRKGKRVGNGTIETCGKCGKKGKAVVIKPDTIMVTHFAEDFGWYLRVTQSCLVKIIVEVQTNAHHQ